MTAPDGYLSVQDAATFIGVCRATLYTMIRAEEIPSVKFGGRRLVPESALRPPEMNAKLDEADHIAQ